MTLQSPLARSLVAKSTWKFSFLEYILEGNFSDKKMLITRQILMVSQVPFAESSINRLTLHKICHFQPFPRFEIPKIFSCGTPFAKNAKMTDFSCLGNLATTLRRQPSL